MTPLRAVVPVRPQQPPPPAAALTQRFETGTVRRLGRSPHARPDTA